MLKYSRYVFFVLSVIFNLSNKAKSWFICSKCSFNVLLNTMTPSIYALTYEYSRSILFIFCWTYASMLQWFITLTFHCSASRWMTTINLCLSDIVILHWWKNVIQFITEMYEHFWALLRMSDCNDIEWASCSNILFKSRISTITLSRLVSDFFMRCVMSHITKMKYEYEVDFDAHFIFLKMCKTSNSLSIIVWFSISSLYTRHVFEFASEIVFIFIHRSFETLTDLEIFF
jgi:hypothetical protein